MINIYKAVKRFKKRTKQVPKMVIVGLLGVIFLYVSASGLISITYPWFRNDNSDTVAHVDMVYRIYNGDLPKASDGVQYKPFIELGGSNVYQRAAGHPPLFHALLAPFMGPLLNEGEWQKAIAVGRAINIFIGILCILALAWAGWLFGGQRKALFAVAVPALGVLTYRYSRINTDLSMDGLLTLWSTLTLICLYKILQRGLKPKYLIFLTLLNVVGMSTKISFAVFLGISLLTIIVASYIHSNGGARREAIKGAIIAVGILSVVIISIGWYYYFRNYKASGSLFTPIEGVLPSSRPYQSYPDIAGGSNFWSLFYARYSIITSISAIITSFAVAGYFAMKKVNLLKLRNKPINLWVIVLMVLAFLGVVTTQLKLAHPYGSINYRYLLPATLPISLFLAYGLLELKWLRGQLVTIAAILMAWTTILSIKLAPAPDGLLSGVQEWGKTVTKIYKAALNNGVPSYVTRLLFLLFIAGAILLSIALYRLSGIRQAKKSQASLQR